MTQEQIKERNRKNELIGRFTGFSSSMSTITDYPDGKLPKSYFLKMKYHSSWDLLMPAIKKFEDIPLKGMNDEKRTRWQRFIFNLMDEVALFEIESAFDELSKAIEWYNSIKKTKK